MKRLWWVLVLALLLAGCTKPLPNPELPASNPAPEATAESTQAQVAADQLVSREGYKIGWSHSGTVVILPESLILLNSQGELVGGKIVVAMKTIRDHESGTGGVAEHLQKEDFFHTDSHPTAVIEATSVSGGVVTANITIKGITKVISFPVVLNSDADMYLLSAQLDLPIRDFQIGTSLLGKVALQDNFRVTLTNVAFIK